MRNRLFIILTLVFTFLFDRLPISSAADNAVDPREAAIDRAIGGMVEGSRPLEPQGYAGKNQTQHAPGSRLNPSMDTRVTASAPGTGNTGANLGGSANVGTGSGSLQGSTQETVSGGTTGTTVEGSTDIGTPTGGSTEPATEPTSSGSTSDSIVNVDANVDLSGGEPAVDANLTVDTNADTLLDANAATTTDTTSTDITATESGTIAGQDLTTTVNEAPLDATLSTEVVATDVPAESEATAGLEADVDPVTSDSDVTTTDPADGLSTGL